MPSDTTHANILRVYSYEPGLKTTKQKRTLELPPTVEDLSAINLGFIRGILAKNGVFEAPDAKAPFCNALGAEMSDDMTFNMYKGQLDEPKQAGEDTQVYYKKRKTTSVLDNVATDFLKKKLDLKLQQAPALKDVRAEILASAFKGSEWKATTSERSIAANLTERDWSVITRTNCLLSGHKLVTREAKVSDTETKIIPQGVASTPFNAFKLKPRIFSDYEVAAPPTSGNGATTSAESGNLLFHIPRFRVDDASSVDVVETRKALQSSLASSAFSKTSIEASAGGGVWGVSAAVKAGFSLSETEQNIEAEAKDNHETHVSYNFPRVTIFLDATSLELTPEVKADIPKVRGKQSLIAFGDKYGDIFSRKVKVGGKLTSTNKVGSKTKTTETQRENALKVSAAASVSGYYGSGSAEGSGSGGSGHLDGNNKQDFDSNMTWEATGGDSTLCNNPPKWCGTVGNFYNWRVVENDNCIPLPELISTFEGFEHVNQRFKKAAEFNDTNQIGDRVYL
ncbi:uncharacterized protein ASPGLDRAFT_182670 [Aspergillus glaucus CBS 516.65]|uniref:MACPF-like domain-containing protein n=1 Tax=Aspergillus glaucus CBS 516.65 TaxID=1160497 RepID=A0A1L9V3A1_ASPGL|nr:hypothetical protein ASPGLDRAFT_182670 [Aspergillus glaucus CBS 516.65]OJJ78425.1 hypothetical protein ASPGLDRAFT_182670 [Aspergillus glaucus CBS 516.65]